MTSFQFDAPQPPRPNMDMSNYQIRRFSDPVPGNEETEDREFSSDPDPLATDSSSSECSDLVRNSWFRMRPPDDDEPEDWWFASTAIPLLAATIGPLANVLSIASIVSKWRVAYDPDKPGDQASATGIEDPHWELVINGVSLACGFAGNLFLLFNFTRAVRYIVALPASILLWYLATGLLTGTISRMVIFEAPNGDNEIWGQSFWYAVMAAALYLIAAMILMINMLGYFLGHYTQHFELTDEQRNLILQTMMFFTWLAGGGGVFAKASDWSYPDALYFCDVTILTVGFGDFAAPNDLGRGLIFPYSVGGITLLGLVVASISKFAKQIGHTNIVHKRIEARRAQTVERSIATSFEAEQRQATLRARIGTSTPQISAPFDPQKRTVAFDRDLEKGEIPDDPEPSSPRRTHSGFKRTMTMLSTISEGRAKSRLQRLPRKSKLLVLREERDRFNAMRHIQNETRRFKKYFALTMSFAAFGVLWCVGAVVFWQAEQATQQLSYFEALYFCYVSLLTIGYGDLSPKSNAGKPFFVVWSLIAVPTMTILVSDLGNTVIAAYKRGTFTLADWSILPKRGVVAEYVREHPRVKKFIELWQTNRRIKRGFDIGPDPAVRKASTIEQLANESNLDEHDMAKRLARAIRETADDLKNGVKRRYTYEQWVEYTRLIRFTKYHDASEEQREHEDKGLIEWDWIGANSPMMADQHECEWVLDRLCESLDRYMHKMVPEHVKERRKSQAERRRSLMEGTRRRSTAGGRTRGSSLSRYIAGSRKASATDQGESSSSRAPSAGAPSTGPPSTRAPSTISDVEERD